MTAIVLNINGKDYSVAVDGAAKLIYVLRDDLGLTGTKFGCGVAECGACTVHLNGAPIRACVTPVSKAIGGKITTIEGLAADGQLSVLQQAWIDHQAPQCGYCQSGQLMEAAALLQRTADPSEQAIREAMNGHLCRCGTYPHVLAAMSALAASRERQGGT